MTKDFSQYSKVLFELGIDENLVIKSFENLLGSEILLAALDNPAVFLKEKHSVIDRLFDRRIGNFIKLVCDNFKTDGFNEIFNGYKLLVLESKNGISAEFICFEKPDNDRIEKIKNKLCITYDKQNAELNIVEDKSILGGFILNVGDDEYDRSIKGALKEIEHKVAWR